VRSYACLWSVLNLVCFSVCFWVGLGFCGGCGCGYSWVGRLGCALICIGCGFYFFTDGV